LAAAPEAVNPARLDLALRFYRHRFRHRRHWGQVAWLEQAFAAWWRVRGERQFADLVFEVTDWALGYQLEKSGAFVNEHQSETPGYTTALYLEGLGAAIRVAAGLGDEARRARYARAAERGL